MFHIPKWHVGLDLKFAFLNVNEIHCSHLPTLKLDYFPSPFFWYHTLPQRLGDSYGTHCKEHEDSSAHRWSQKLF